MEKTYEICWICDENPANSGEHSIKHRDLKHFYPQSKSVYFHNETSRNQLLLGTDDKKLKPVKICAKCNNERLQPFDMAWDKLFDQFNCAEPDDYKLYFNNLNFSTKKLIHLFGVAKLGCVFIEGAVDIDLASFSKAIMSKTAHPNIYLKFIDLNEFNVGRSDLKISRSENEIDFAIIQVDSGYFACQFMYATPSDRNLAKLGITSASIKPNELELELNKCL